MKKRDFFILCAVILFIILVFVLTNYNFASLRYGPDETLSEISSSAIIKKGFSYELIDGRYSYVSNGRLIEINLNYEKNEIFIRDDYGLSKDNINAYKVNYESISYDNAGYIIKKIRDSRNTLNIKFEIPDNNDYILHIADNGGNPLEISLIEGKSAKQISSLLNDLSNQKFEKELTNAGIIGGGNENLGGGCDDFSDCAVGMRLLFFEAAEVDGTVGGYAQWWKKNANERIPFIEDKYKQAKYNFISNLMSNGVAQVQYKDFQELSNCPEYQTIKINVGHLPQGDRGIVLVDKDCYYCDVEYPGANNPSDPNHGNWLLCREACEQLTTIDNGGNRDYKVVFNLAAGGNNILGWIRNQPEYIPYTDDVIPIIFVDRIGHPFRPHDLNNIYDGLDIGGSLGLYQGVAVIAYETAMYHNSMGKYIAHEVFGHGHGLGHTAQNDPNNILYWQGSGPMNTLDFQQAVAYRAHSRNCATLLPGGDYNNQGFYPRRAGQYGVSGNILGQGCGQNKDRLLTRAIGNIPLPNPTTFTHVEECDNTYQRFLLPDNVRVAELGQGVEGNPLSYCPIIVTPDMEPGNSIVQRIIAVKDVNVPQLRAAYGDDAVRFCVPPGFLNEIDDCTCKTYEDIIQEDPGAVFPPGWIPVGPAAPPPPPPPQAFTPLPAGKKACEDVTEVPSSGPGGGHTCPNAVCTEEKEECKPNPMAGATKCKCVGEGKFPKCGDGYIYYNEDWTIDRIVCPPNDCKTDFGDDHECVGEITGWGTRFPGDEAAGCFCKPIQPAGN